MKSNMATSFTQTMRTAYSTSMNDFLKQGEDIWRGKNVIHDSQGYLCMYGEEKEYGCMYGPERQQTQKEKYKEQRRSQNPTKRPHPQDNTSDSNTELKIRRKRSACSGRVGVRAEAMQTSIDVGSIYETPQTTAL
ncbi:uncharacterized protein [Watersipora subatra]|uniref:uncharacterized protein n=1 Tax=Watersipora subatra TaxID=2589382 RepID=UPI00355B61BF